MRYLVLFFALACASLSGCGSRNLDTSYAGKARYTYEQGLEAYEDGDYLEAVKRFTQVKNKHAYSKYAALAELRIADSFYAQDKFIEAIDAYRMFMQGRPNHREVPYAMWRIGEANYSQVPSDFILFPPVHEKDQAATKDALRAFQRYLKRFPKHEKSALAKERLLACRGALADHEMYVARYYLGQRRPVSARGRLEGVVRDYDDVPSRWLAAAWLLVGVYVDLEMPAKAVETARLIVTSHPRSDEAEEARVFIAAAR